MLMRIVKEPIQIVRNGRFEMPPVGAVFEFTEEEVRSIGAANKAALGLPVTSDEALVAKQPLALKPKSKK